MGAVHQFAAHLCLGIGSIIKEQHYQGCRLLSFRHVVERAAGTPCSPFSPLLVAMLVVDNTIDRQDMETETHGEQ
eukprot:SAG31_NODE_38_length_31498_cov_41.930539_18_plen_75_part_00